jgi:hypothetical protein
MFAIGKAKKRLSHAVQIDDRRPYAQGEVYCFTLGFSPARTWPKAALLIPGCGWPSGSRFP